MTRGTKRSTVCWIALSSTPGSGLSFGSERSGQRPRASLRRDPSKRGSAEAILQRIEALKEGELSADAEARLDEELRSAPRSREETLTPSRATRPRDRPLRPGARPTALWTARARGARLGDAEVVSAAQTMPSTLSVCALPRYPARYRPSW